MFWFYEKICACRHEHKHHEIVVIERCYYQSVKLYEIEDKQTYVTPNCISKCVLWTSPAAPNASNATLKSWVGVNLLDVAIQKTWQK